MIECSIKKEFDHYVVVINGEETRCDSYAECLDEIEEAKKHQS